jgi:hypothetical protein
MYAKNKLENNKKDYIEERGPFMHIAMSIYCIYMVWRKGVWRNWRKYHTTMMYFALGNLLYNFLTANHFLWRFSSEFLANHTTVEMLYTFIVFPATVLLFLSHYPEGKSFFKKAYHVFIWVVIYGVVEFVYWQLDKIHYQYGWNLWWSIFFDFTMFPMLVLFHKRPLLAYTISFFMAIFWVQFFDVPVHIPVEDR